MELKNILFHAKPDMTIQEFTEFIRNIAMDGESMNEEEVRKIFDIFDKDQDGILNQQETYTLNKIIDRLNSIKVGLIVVDFQNDFVTGSLAIKDGPAGQDPLEALPHLNCLLATGKFDLVVYTKDWHPVNHSSFQTYPSHCVQGTIGAKLYPDLVVVPEAKYILKGTDVHVDSPSGFMGDKGKKTELEAMLRNENIELLFVCGLAYEICVAATAFDAANLGFYTAVISNCSKGIQADKIVEVNQKFVEMSIPLIDSKIAHLIHEKKFPSAWILKLIETESVSQANPMKTEYLSDNKDPQNDFYEDSLLKSQIIKEINVADVLLEQVENKA